MVEIKTDGSRASIKIDGKEIGNRVSSYKLVHNGGDFPTLELTIYGDDITLDTCLVPELPEVYKSWYEPKRPQDNLPMDV